MQKREVGIDSLGNVLILSWFLQLWSIGTGLDQVWQDNDIEWIHTDQFWIFSYQTRSPIYSLINLEPCCRNGKVSLFNKHLPKHILKLSKMQANSNFQFAHYCFLLESTVWNLFFFCETFSLEATWFSMNRKAIIHSTFLLPVFGLVWM